MQCIMYATGTYSKLSKLNSDIQIFNFGYLTTGTCIPVFMGARIRGSLVIFRNQKGSANLKVWTTLR